MHSNGRFPQVAALQEGKMQNKNGENMKGALVIKAVFTRLLWTCTVALLALTALPAQAGVKIQSWQAKSGAKVLFVVNHDLPMLDVAVHLDAGSRRDSPALAGRAALVAGMMQLGAGGLSEETIAKRLADVGAEMGPSFDRDRAGYSLRTLSSPREREQALDVLAKVLQAPDFPEAVLQREKARTIAALREAETQPAAIANKVFYKAVYGDHPYGLPSGGEVATVSKLTRDDLLQFYQQHYGPKRAVVSIIGDVNRAEAEAIANQLTDKLSQHELDAAMPEVVPLPKPEVQRIPHPATQAHILIGAPGIARSDPDYFSLYVGNYILGGGGFDSRILNEIRQKRGLAYSAYSYFIPYQQPGPFELGMQTKKQDADVALKVAQQTLNNFMQNGPTEAELKQAKNNIILGFPLRIDNNRKLLEYLGVIGFYNLPLTYLDDFTHQIEKVNVRAIQAAFKRHVHPNKMVTVMVGAPEVVAQ